jgi:hypothetical protein
MKLSQLSILFVGILLLMLLSTDIRTDNLEAIAETKNDMDFYMNKAMESAAKALLQVDATTGKEILDKDKAADTFFSSMYASLGILSDPVAQENFRAYVPVIAVPTRDGYYLMYNDNFVGTDGYTYISRRWTEKIPYSYEDDYFIYKFTMDTDMVLYDKNNIIDATGLTKMYRVNASDIRSLSEYASLRTAVGANNFLMKEESFSLVRQQAIISHMEDELSWYISRHNDIAKRYGITYQFTLPVANTSEWAKTMEGPSIIVIFQGRPLIEDKEKVYNRMAFSGSGIVKDRVYYIEQHGWYYLYHREGCLKLVGNINVRDEHYYSVEECAELGAFACDICDPVGVQVPDYTP